MATTSVAPTPNIMPPDPPPGALLRPLAPIQGLPPGAFLRQIGPRLAGPALAHPPSNQQPDAQPGTTSATKPFFDWLDTPITSGRSSDHLTAGAQKFADKWNQFKGAHPTLAAVIDPVSAEADWEKRHPNAAAAHEAVNEFGHSMETPKSLAMLVAMPAWRPLSAFFAAQSAHGAYQSAEAAFQAFREGNNPQATKYATEAGLDALMGLAAAGHAARGGSRVATEGPETSQIGKTSQPGQNLITDIAKYDKLSHPEKSDVVPRGTEAHPPIGETEPETGRPVLQQSPRPEVNQAAATAEHPAIHDTLQKLVEPIEGAEVAGHREEKDEERLGEKMEGEGQSPRTVRDYSGFRIAVDSPAARDQVVSNLRKNFEVPNESDEFDKGAEETGFHGHTLQVREPGSPVTHEVQVLPREVADAAEERHPLYEKAREGDQDAAAQLKTANEADWQKFVMRNAQRPEGGTHEPLSTETPTKKAASEEPKFKFGSTQANIPEDSEAAAALKTAREKIAPEDRAGNVNDAKGGLVDEPHVTVKYGIKGDDVEGIKNYLESQAPFEATLGKTDKFPASEHSDGAAPIIAPIDAPQLHRIQAELEQHGDFEPSSFPEYKPHATLGYVKPGAADKYVGMGETEGKKFTISSISISDRNGNLTEVPLKGASEGANEGPEKSPTVSQSSSKLKAPVPPDRSPKAAKWEKGERFLVRDPATGNYRAGEVTYFNEGVNGAKPGGRSRVGETKLDEVPRDALRLRGIDRDIRPVAGTDVEREIIDRTKRNLPKLVGDYLERNTEDGVPTLATDAAKELFPEFEADATGMDRETAAGGKAIRDAALETVLAAPVDPKRPDVLINTASPGSGKTTGLAGGGSLSRVGIKVESIADDYTAFSKLVQDVIDSGRRPIINFVYVDEPAKTVRRMFLRAAGHGDKPGIGRTVQLKYMADAYTKIPRVLEQIRSNFGDKVKILAVDNSGLPGTAKVTSDIDPLLAAIRRKSYNQVFEEMTNETRKLESEGHFDSDRGKAILKAAQTSEPAGSDEAQGRPTDRGTSGIVGSGGGKAQRPQMAGSVLNKVPINDSAVQTAAPGSGRSVSFERFKEAARRKGGG